MPPLNNTISNIVVGDDIDIDRTVLNVPGNDSLLTAWFTVKLHESDLDSAAIVQKKINGSAVPGVGQITNSGSTGTGTVVFQLTNVDTLSLSGNHSYYYDIQVLTANGKIYTPEKGTITLQNQITRSTS